jgi:hypothetical protein
MAGILEPLGEKSEVVRHGLLKLEALEDFEGSFRQLAKMPVDDPHMRDPRVQRSEVVLCGPGGVGVRNRVLDSELGDCCMRACLEVREQLWKKFKRSLYEHTPVRICKPASKEEGHFLSAWASVSLIISPSEA